MSDFSYEFDTPEHLLDKLSRELQRYDIAIEQNNQSNAIDHALNFVISAWSLCDWLWESGRGIELAPSKTKLKHWVKCESEQMRICADLANGAKHFRLLHGSEIVETRAHQKTVSTSGIVRSVVSDVVRPVLSPVAGAEERKLTLELETESLGVVQIRDLFAGITKFWEAALSRVPPKET